MFLNSFHIENYTFFFFMSPEDVCGFSVYRKSSPPLWGNLRENQLFKLKGQIRKFIPFPLRGLCRKAQHYERRDYHKFFKFIRPLAQPLIL
jgi:hypothetical protein